MLIGVPESGASENDCVSSRIKRLLSSLRVFSAKINAKEMNVGRQNVVLKLLHQLTRFFPAVRAIRILMDGRTLKSNECAAIAQTFAEALRDLVPRSLIGSDERRYLEGTRLLLGFVLQKAEALSKTPASLDKPTEDGLPYLHLFRTVDVREIRTNEHIIDPVQTNLGLMEKGCFDAFKPGGILSESGAEDVEILSVSTDPGALRAALLNGGAAPELSYYDTDAIQASLSVGPASSHILEEVQSFSRDLPYLGRLCDKNGMTVIHPTSLKAASARSLTLDRDSYLCVYVGRAACAAPDRDISIFRPLSGTEESVDVKIMAQLIEPIARACEQDGTTVFDVSRKSLHFKNSKPTELLMFCVDCSRSMYDGSDFHDSLETPVVPGLRDSTPDNLPATGE